MATFLYHIYHINVMPIKMPSVSEEVSVLGKAQQLIMFASKIAWQDFTYTWQKNVAKAFFFFRKLYVILWYWFTPSPGPDPGRRGRGVCGGYFGFSKKTFCLLLNNKSTTKTCLIYTPCVTAQQRRKNLHSMCYSSTKTLKFTLHVFSSTKIC